MDAALDAWAASPDPQTAAAWEAYEDARLRWLEGRQRAESAVWREMFGRRDPAPGMPTKWVGEAPEAWRADVAASADDFRRMVPAERLARVGEVEVERAVAGKDRYIADAGLVYRRPAKAGSKKIVDKVWGFGSEDYYGPPEARRIRVSPAAPTRTTELRFVGEEAKEQPPLPMHGSWAVVHELAHHLEHAEPGLVARAAAFQKARGHGLDARKKKFPIRSYAAERYTDGGKVRSTEVVSVGVEQLYRRPAEFARVDPEYFDFIWKNVVTD